MQIHLASDLLWKYQRLSLLVMLYNVIFLSHCDMVTWFSDTSPSLGEILLLGAFSMEITRAFVLPSMQSFCGVTGSPALNKMPDIPGPPYKNNCAHTVTHQEDPSSPDSLEPLKMYWCTADVPQKRYILHTAPTSLLPPWTVWHCDAAKEEAFCGVK